MVCLHRRRALFFSAGTHVMYDMNPDGFKAEETVFVLIGWIAPQSEFTDFSKELRAPFPLLSPGLWLVLIRCHLPRPPPLWSRSRSFLFSPTGSPFFMNQRSSILYDGSFVEVASFSETGPPKRK